MKLCIMSVLLLSASDICKTFLVNVVVKNYHKKYLFVDFDV